MPSRPSRQPALVRPRRAPARSVRPEVLPHL